MIKCVNVHKDFGNVKAVNGVNITIEDGTFLGLLGPNGAGKTTLLRMMIGLLNSSNGHIQFDDQKIRRDAYDIKKQIGVVTQHINLDKELSVLENMIFSGMLYKLDKKEIMYRINYLIDFTGLESVKNRVSKHLSGGMKRKLMIAKALIHNPKYIFLDEPTVGIDVNARKEIWELLRIMHNEGKTIILTTHYIEEAESLCNRVMLMNDGEIFDDATPRQLIEEVGIYTVEYFNSSQRSKCCYYSDIEEAKRYAADLNQPYTIRNTTLEDVFYRFTNKKVNEWK